MSTSDPAATFYRAREYPPEDSVGYLVRRLNIAMGAEMDKRLAPHGLTSAQWEPVYRLRLCPSSTVAELARVMQTDPGATTRMLDRLEAKGLCRRERSTADRRVVHVELTPEGEALADQMPPIWAEVMNAYLAGFSQPEWRTLLSLLQRVLANADALREAPPPSPPPAP